ncbi:MAG: YfiR family protein, partial [Ignavibacteriales bacterium]|nr:YfiR family protein [Ignavibacteriales bacterium]
HASKSQTIVVPVEIHLPILFKVLNLEKGMSKSDTATCIVAIVYESSNASSIAVMNEIVAFGKREHQNLMEDKSVRFVAVDIHETKNIQALLHKTKAHVLYVAPITPDALQMITNASQKEKMLSMTGVPEYVDDGVSLGVGVKGDSPEIIINLTSSREEGSEFSSKVLGVARIVQ